MPTNNEETLFQRYEREEIINKKIESEINSAQTEKTGASEMNQADILKLAEEAGFGHMSGFLMPPHVGHITAELTRFAELVAQHEREECATLIQDYAGNCVMTGYEVAKKIRARNK